MKGTPKTLREAIQNGVDEAVHGAAIGTTEAIIEKHARDFLAQKFAASFLRSEDEELGNLWEAIKKAA